MRVLRSWLQEYVKIDLNNDELVSKLVETGTDVEAITNETLFDLDITPNRGDCLSHLGIAREIAAIEGTSARREPIKLIMDSRPASSEISVEIESTKYCNQYLARVIKGVKIGSSPEWLTTRLEKIGLKSINNVVDVTNYIMYDLGQPLHAFDASKISGNKIIVRLAMKDEKITTLEGKERMLKPENLVIADSKKTIAVAGVIGGGNSEISEETVDIILEAAVFDRRSIRKTAKQLGLVTDASYRFERGIDEAGLEYAINKAAYLIKKIAGGTILTGIVRQGQTPKIHDVEIRAEKINSLLGLNLSNKEIDTLLRRLGFEIESEICKVPSWRHDIFTWHDLAEEVGRLYGYDNIPLKKLPAMAQSEQSGFYFKEALKDQLISLGFVETINYPFLSEIEIKLFDINVKELLEVANPVQPENKYLRSSLISGLLRTISKNSIFSPLAVFEVGQVFSKSHEDTHMALAVAAKDQKSFLELIEQVKSRLSGLLDLASTLKVQEIDQESLKKLKIRKPSVVYFEINLSDILQKLRTDKKFDLIISKEEVVYRPVSRFPSVTRDLAFVINRDIKPQDIINAIYEFSPRINRVELFDEFASDKLGKNKKNVAFHLFLQDMNKTLSDNDADEVIKGIIGIITEEFSATLRA